MPQLANWLLAHPGKLFSVLLQVRSRLCLSFLTLQSCESGRVARWGRDFIQVYPLIKAFKEQHPKLPEILWCGVFSRTRLAGLSVLLHEAKCISSYSRVLRVV